MKLWTTEEACYRYFEKKVDFEPESPSVTGKVCYHYNSWVTGIYMAFIFHKRLSGWLSHLRLSDHLNQLYGLLAALSALQCFDFPWIPAAKAACLQELAGYFRPRLSYDAQNRAFAKKTEVAFKSYIRPDINTIIFKK